MIADAIPVMRGVPLRFADPVLLAQGHADGTAGYVVASYAADRDSSTHTHDVFVVKGTPHGGRIVAVCRLTPDFRFTVDLSVALDRFHRTRSGMTGTDPSASLTTFSAEPPRLIAFLRSIYFEPCLKLHTHTADGDRIVTSADVLRQLSANGCTSGMIEANRISADALATEIRLLPFTTPTDLSASAIDGLLDGLTGRVMLYDERKNADTIRAKSSSPFDVLALWRDVDAAALSAESRRASLVEPVTETVVITEDTQTTTAKGKQSRRRVVATTTSRPSKAVGNSSPDGAAVESAAVGRLMRQLNDGCTLFDGGNLFDALTAGVTSDDLADVIEAEAEVCDSGPLPLSSSSGTGPTAEPVLMLTASSADDLRAVVQMWREVETATRRIYPVDEAEARLSAAIEQVRKSRPEWAGFVPQRPASTGEALAVIHAAERVVGSAPGTLHPYKRARWVRLRQDVSDVMHATYNRDADRLERLGVIDDLGKAWGRVKNG